jgi:N-acetylneuraminate synthase
MENKHITELEIDGRKIGKLHPTFIISEIGINHNGDFELAKKLIELSVDAGADCVKFQMRDMTSLYNNSGNPDDIKENLSTQYILDLLSKFQLTKDQMFELFDYCKELNVIPLCTPWDESTLDDLEEYGMSAYKLSSADLTNHNLIDKVIKTGKPLIISTGMSYEFEIEETAKRLNEKGAQFAFLHCNSTYPPHPKDINLKYIKELEKFGTNVVGYSGHERGYHISVASIALGANIIEKHFTVDREMEGNDHKVSLLPEEFKSMVKNIREVEMSLGDNNLRTPNQGELMNRVNLAKSLVINCDLKKGEKILDSMIEVKSPGRGLQPNYRTKLVGRKSKRDFKEGDFFFLEDVKEGEIVTSRNYKFNRKWGIPVRYHDYKLLMDKTNPDFLEFHLSYKDMDQNYEDFFTEKLNMGLVVHSPDTFAGDHLLNLASDDEEYRYTSIRELQRVIDLTVGLSKYISDGSTPLIVVSVGGFSKDKFFTEKEKEKAYEVVADSLSQLNQKGVQIIPQTLPPFPWYFGGQLFCNLFVTPDDTVKFCETYGYKICFDISHSKLASNYHKIPFDTFVDKVGKYIKHLHLVDAEGIDGEGLQIDEGDVDFDKLSAQLRDISPEASFIPEIWMGHENEGEKQWVALERLEKYFNVV